MTRGHRGSLLLRCKALASSPFCRFIPAHHPFEEAFFRPYARQFLDAVRTPIILLGGVNRLATVDAAIEEGFAAVAMGRALIREPDLVARYQKDDRHEPRCVHCNACVAETYRDGARCVLVPERR